MIHPKILDELTDFSKLETWNSIIGIIGFIITIATFIVSNNARRAVREIQNNFTSDKRIPEHLEVLNKSLKAFNKLLENIPENERKINIILGEITSNLNSLNVKIIDRDSKRLILQAKKEINNVRKYNDPKSVFLYEILNKIPVIKLNRPDINDAIWNSYGIINEVHTTIKNLQKDKETRLR